MTINEWPYKCFGFIGNKVILIYCVGENIKIVVSACSNGFNAPSRDRPQ